MDIRQTVGGNIMRERRRRALSQEALAFAAGVDQAYVSIVENGAGNLTLSLIERFANALEVPPDLLLRPPEE
ncbi:MAG: helix-turn-helix transcriptional regulator [Pseudomonadota bacterium]